MTDAKLAKDGGRGSVINCDSVDSGFLGLSGKV
jgi:hypothetical protein